MEIIQTINNLFTGVNPVLIREIFGYIGTVIVAASFLMRSQIKLRMVNATGGLICVVYSLIIKAYPIVALNGFIFCANVFFLVQYYRQKEYFRLVPIGFEDTLLSEFLAFYKDDIEKYFPDFYHIKDKNLKSFYILRNMIPAGVFIIRDDGKGSAEVLLDYVTLEFRDTKIGKFIFDQNASYFTGSGIKRFYIRVPESNTHKYIKKIGFVLKDNHIYEKIINKK